MYKAFKVVKKLQYNNKKLFLIIQVQNMLFVILLWVWIYFNQFLYITKIKKPNWTTRISHYDSIVEKDLINKDKFENHQSVDFYSMSLNGKMLTIFFNKEVIHKKL